MQLSVIIPTLNERAGLPTTLDTVRAQYGVAEIIVVDGGSADGTRDFARAQSGVTVVESARGRGAQLAAGVSASSGDTLLFLHADCLLPAGATEFIETALQRESIAGGAFGIRFAATSPPSLHRTAKWVNARSRLFKVATGDQAIFARRTAYDLAGGFPPWPLFEDMEFVKRLKRHGQFTVAPIDVEISARRWETYGIGRTNTLMCALYAGYRAGVKPHTLKRWFADVRPARR
jgi:rSAM/selenodomain-associated transferase 2